MMSEKDHVDPVDFDLEAWVNGAVAATDRIEVSSRAGLAMQRERMTGAELDQRAQSDQARIGIDQQRLQQESQLGQATLGIQQQQLGIEGRKAAAHRRRARQAPPAPA